MTTVIDIIARAHQQIGVVRRGGAPDPPTYSDGLKALQSLIDHLSGFGGSVPYRDYAITSAVTLGRDDMGVRLLCTAGGVSVTLPQQPRDGARLALVDVAGTFDVTPATLIAQGMRTEEEPGDLTIDQADFNGAWMYRADEANWRRITQLTLQSDMPYPEDFDRSFEAMLGVEVWPDYYGTDPIPAVTTRQAEIGYQRLAARYVPPLPMRVDNALLGWRPSQPTFPYFPYPYGSIFS